MILGLDRFAGLIFFSQVHPQPMSLLQTHSLPSLPQWNKNLSGKFDFALTFGEAPKSEGAKGQDKNSSKMDGGNSQFKNRWCNITSFPGSVSNEGIYQRTKCDPGEDQQADGVKQY